MKKRALLLSGGVNDAIDHQRYRNDIEAFFRVLTEHWGYDENDVRLHVGRGSPLRFNTASGQHVLDAHSARPQHVLEGLEWLAELGTDDRLFFMATDHGVPEGISLWGKGNYLTPQRLTAILGESKATKVLVFGQCHSGVFGLHVPPKSVVCAACTANEASRHRRPPMPGMQPQYDEFLYQFAGALAGKYPDGQALAENGGLAKPPNITIAEAFRYARDMDAWYPNSFETPQLFDPDNLAAHLTL
ncbi:MAG TPA: hypothetical protein PKA58_35345 [Polyangium sp.]|nr:hypothetical protein [Polyangium sp.]